MSRGIRLNLIGLWLQDKRGDEFYQAVESIRKKMTPSAFSSFLDAWCGATDNYKVRLELPSLQVTDEGLLHMTWFDSTRDVSFTLDIHQDGLADWFAYSAHTGWSDGLADEYPTKLANVPLDMVTRFFKVEDDNVEA